MSTTYKRLLLGIVLVLLVGILGWGALFKYGLKYLKEEVLRAEISLKEKGFEFTYANLDVYGSPLILEAIIHHPHLKAPQGKGEWQGEGLRLSMRPWRWKTFTYTLIGVHKVAFSPSGIEVMGGQGKLALNSKGNLEELSFLADQMKFFSGTHPRPLFLERITLNLKDVGHPLALQLYVTSTIKGMEGILQEKASLQPIAFSLDAQLKGFQEIRGVPHSLEEWRDGGGVLEVNLLRFSWAPLDISGEGTLTFDHDMYPLGAFSTRITGYQEGLTHLVKGGVVAQKNAAMAGFVLDMLSRSGKTVEKQINVPVTLQDRRISVGSIPLVHMK